MHPLLTLLIAFATPALSVRPTQPLPPSQSVLVDETQGMLHEPMVLRSLTDQRSVPKWLRDSTVAVSLDQERLAMFAHAGGGVLTDLPCGPWMELDVHLAPIAALSTDAWVEVQHARAPRRTPFVGDAVVLAGGVVGVDASTVFLASSDAGTFGFVEIEDQLFIISSGPVGSKFPTVSYELHALPEGALEPPSWTCETVDPPSQPSDALAHATDGGVAGGGAGGVCRQVRVAFETDHEFFQLLGGSVSAVEGYVATLAGALNTIYTREANVRISASFVRVWATPSDPWTATTPSLQLTQFKSNWDATMVPIVRDIAHFLSGRPLGGGVANLPGICTGPGGSASGGAAYGLSANLNGFFPTPLVNNNAQNWDVIVVAHEIGHNLGARHTHAFAPPLDGCGLSPQDCSVASAQQGTIMSYCHTCAGGLANMQLAFHPANVAEMLDRFAQIPCVYEGAAVAPIATADRVDAYGGVPRVVDVLANDFPFNCESITIGGNYPITSLNGAIVSRTSPSDPMAYDRLVYTHENGAFSGPDSFEYIVVDASGQTAVGTVRVQVTPLRTPENPIGVASGIDVAYYALSAPTALPDFTLLSPYASSTLADIHFPASSGTFASSGRADNLGVVFQGWIEVPESGGWTFTVASDEGSRLLIGNTVVVNHDGLHGMTTKSGEIGLAAGRHAIRVEYFERTGDAGLIVSWRSPSGVEGVVPAGAFSRGGRDSIADIDNDGSINAGDLSLILAGWGTSNSAADLTGDGVVNAFDLSRFLFEWLQ